MDGNPIADELAKIKVTMAKGKMPEENQREERKTATVYHKSLKICEVGGTLNKPRSARIGHLE